MFIYYPQRYTFRKIFHLKCKNNAQKKQILKNKSKSNFNDWLAFGYDKIRDMFSNKFFQAKCQRYLEFLWSKE